ncbi:aminoglycoside phosphotransferase family protein [Streptomyces sp. NBC_00237]|uniref:phosphotransferase enzyme family protein n=1 Tax=Streptomyces sp. NBC_00237 TaxID=2975687 RepID=UPI0022597D10|nr:aminoglycoside phosphotransferase family protein [Streptomyces sp. NBC_00237]MCX5206885.1 aminoglycoside phosphotransferase family protein [Streptomyces sp. NBC_00237]
MNELPLSPEAAAVKVCRELGMEAETLVPLRSHATAVFLLPEAHTVVRVSRAGGEASIARAVAVTRWLADQGVPVTEPLDVKQPVLAGEYVVSLWDHYPQPEGAPPGVYHLGVLLRQLHEVQLPPVELPSYQPHVSLRESVRASVALSSEDADWLLGRSDELVKAYSQLDFPLGEGLIHGDAYPGNVLWDGAGARLGDWDEAAFGPREVDLANTFQGVRFGRTQEQLRAFSEAYGYDLAGWPGLLVLTELRDLHTLGSFIRRVDKGDEEAAAQLWMRLEVLKSGDREAAWRAH